LTELFHNGGFFERSNKLTPKLTTIARPSIDASAMGPILSSSERKKRVIKFQSMMFDIFRKYERQRINLCLWDTYMGLDVFV
jgi:hypothetical protein